jgi:hypothetical protein
MWLTCAKCNAKPAPAQELFSVFLKKYFCHNETFFLTVSNKNRLTTFVIATLLRLQAAPRAPPVNATLLH